MKKEISGAVATLLSTLPNLKHFSLNGDPLHKSYAEMATILGSYAVFNL